MKVVKLLRGDDASEQCAALEVFTGAYAHGWNVHRTLCY